MEEFFRQNEFLSLGVIIVDARHEPTADDKIMADWFMGTGCPMAVVANKTDKLTKNALGGCSAVIRSKLELGEDRPLILFSAEKGTNREALLKEIEKNAKK